MQRVLKVAVKNEYVHFRDNALSSGSSGGDEEYRVRDMNRGHMFAPAVHVLGRA